MDSTGRLYRLTAASALVAAYAADARGLTMVTRTLTPREEEEGRIRFCSPCGCGSGKKFKHCCYGKRLTPTVPVAPEAK